MYSRNRVTVLESRLLILLATELFVREYVPREYIANAELLVSWACMESAHQVLRE